MRQGLDRLDRTVDRLVEVTQAQGQQMQQGFTPIDDNLAG